MKNPLNKRFIRELKEDWSKYLVIFLLMTGMIGLVSGFIVADESMIKAYNESFEKYTIEDGHFNVDKKLNNQSLINISKAGVRLYDHSYVEETLINGNKLRIFATPQSVNKVCVMKGRLPQNDKEIAIDDDFTLSFTNKIKRYELPQTGGRGIEIYLAGGVVFMSMAVIILSAEIKRRKGGAEKV